MSKLSFQKIQPGTIPFPEKWFQKADTNIWPIPEGLWFRDKGDEYLARVMFLSTVVVELPEALTDLTVCIDHFKTEFASSYIDSYRQFMTRASQAKNPEMYSQLWTSHNTIMTKNLQSKTNKLLAIYQPWADKWAVGSQLMSAWIFADIFYTIVVQSLGVDPRFYKKEMLSSRGDLARAMVSSSYPELKNEYRVLLDPHMPKAKKRQRKEARKELQQRNFYRKRDGELITAARWWVIVRILKYSESELVNNKIPLYDDGSGGIAMSNFSHSILAPYDEALNYTPPKGRPRKEG
ncbi:hypothetical protein ACFLXH_00950 [Chloroflexota bacterium]